jgi:thiol:disulfide interchange protein
MNRAANLLAIALFSMSVPAQAAPAPRVTSIASLSELATPLPYPFDNVSNAEAANSHVDAALDEGRRTHRLVFIDLGANWCADCRILAGLMLLPEYKRFIDAHYVVVNVDFGRYNRNMQIPARWGIVELEGAPTILIVDPDTDRLVNAGHTDAMSEARDMTPQTIMDWLAQWAR